MNDIISKKYKLGEYRIFFIYEPKKRVIEALPFKDRVVIKCFCDGFSIFSLSKSIKLCFILKAVTEQGGTQCPCLHSLEK